MSEAEMMELGEHLYKIIVQAYPEFAGKLTGMLMQLGKEECEACLDSQEKLAERLDEAMQILDAAGQGVKKKAPKTPSDPEERRVDPEDGQSRTFQELQELSKGTYTDQEILDYWETMRPVPTDAAKKGPSETGGNSSATEAKGGQGAPIGDEEVLGLSAWLAELKLSEYREAAEAWTKEQGACNLDEILENVDEFAEGLGLKPMERGRVIKQGQEAAKGAREAAVAARDQAMAATAAAAKPTPPAAKQKSAPAAKTRAAAPPNADERKRMREARRQQQDEEEEEEIARREKDEAERLARELEEQRAIAEAAYLREQEELEREMKELEELKKMDEERDKMRKSAPASKSTGPKAPSTRVARPQPKAVPDQWDRENELQEKEYRKKQEAQQAAREAEEAAKAAEEKRQAKAQQEKERLEKAAADLAAQVGGANPEAAPKEADDFPALGAAGWATAKKGKKKR